MFSSPGAKLHINPSLLSKTLFVMLLFFDAWTATTHLIYYRFFLGSFWGYGGVREVRTRGTIAFASKTLNEADQDYAASERELLALVDALRWLRSNLHGQSTIVRTDHYPLRFLEIQDLLSARRVH